MNKRLLETEIRTTLAYASGDLLVVFMVAVSILLSPPPSHFLGGFWWEVAATAVPSHSLSLPPTCTAGQSTVNQHFIVFRPCWHPPHYLWQTLPGNKHNHGRVLRPLLPDHTPRPSASFSQRQLLVQIRSSLTHGCLYKALYCEAQLPLLPRWQLTLLRSLHQPLLHQWSAAFGALRERPMWYFFASYIGIYDQDNNKLSVTQKQKK